MFWFLAIVVAVSVDAVQEAQDLRISCVDERSTQLKDCAVCAEDKARVDIYIHEASPQQDADADTVEDASAIYANAIAIAIHTEADAPASAPFANAC